MAPLFSFILTTITLIQTFTSALPATDYTYYRRDPATQLLPYLDYEGIDIAARESMRTDLRRRGLHDFAERTLGPERRAPGCKK